MSNSYNDKPLQGYRLAVISDVRLISERMLLDFGADVLHVSRAPTSDFEVFIEWWKSETERAVRDQMQLVVVKSYYSREFSYLRQIEEEEWYTQGEQPTRVRFTTEQKLADAISLVQPFTDDWGDIIESFDQSNPTDHIIATETSEISSSEILLTLSQNESINNIVVHGK